MKTIFFNIFLVWFLFAHTAQAICECKPNSQDWKKVAAEKAFIFAGKFTSGDSSKAKVEVTQAFKGDVPKKLMIVNLGNDCQQNLGDFKKDTEYIFATPVIKDDEKDGSIFASSVCTTAKLRSEEKELEKWLSSQKWKSKILK